MSVAKKHVLGFSPNGGKLFALVDDQGILRIWDTETNTQKQEFTSNLHASGPCTALTWVTAGASRKKKSAKFIDNNKLYLALGTLKGNVVLYSIAEGKVERVLGGDSHNGPVQFIVYDNEARLYSVGKDCRVHVWSLAEERCTGQWSVGPEKPHKIAYLAKSRALVVASRQLKIYDVDTKELVETCTGHSGEINAIASFTATNNVEYVLTTARMERIISLWKVNKKGKNKASTCTLLMEDVSHNLACEVRDDGSLRVASVTRNGNIHIYLLDVNSLSTEKYIKPKVSLQIASDGANTVEPIYAIAAHFVEDAQHSHEILFGYGSLRLLQFERYTPNYAEKLNVIVRTDPKKLYTKNQRGDQSSTQAALKSQLPIVQVADVEYNSAVPISKKKLQNELPMEARLQGLTIQAAKLSDGKLQSQSKTQLLMQALHSQNQVMLKNVLNTVRKQETVRLTLDRLPLEYISPLLNELSTMLQGKTNQVRCALQWLKILAITHTSVMMSENKQELHDKLAICLGIAEQRMHCLTEILQVSGRVKLIINQLERNTIKDLNESNVLTVFESSDRRRRQPGENEWDDLEKDEDEDDEDDDDDGVDVDIDDDDDDDDEDDDDDDADDDEKMEADDDVAADEEDLIMTQNSDDEEDVNDQDEDEDADTDASAG